MKYILTKEFEAGLNKFDFFCDEENISSRLLFTNDSTKDSHEHIALESAKKYQADAVYFRHFDNNRPPMAQIYIYDLTSKIKSTEEITEMHKKLWNAGQVPLIFIFKKTEVIIMNCLKQPVLDHHTNKINYSPLETIKLASEIEEELDKFKEFSATKFDNGSFWEDSLYKDKFKLENSAYETLLNYLRKLRNDLIKKNILPSKITQKLLVMSILVIYLEERKDDEGNTIFPKKFFQSFAKNAKCFKDIFRKKGACLSLFDNLNTHFDGEIFAWNNLEERKKILNADLSVFSDFLEGKTEKTGQINFWPLYSFNDLPIELISNIYEDFLESKPGVVYTPPYLVNFLINESMPLNKPENDYKILDPSCGSGIFLVAAYTRLINWWRIENNWKKPSLAVLKRLLRGSIYGVDINPEAINLTIFSLSLVLCDTLSPKVIWNKLKFDKLIGKNLFAADFFELLYNKDIQIKFNLIIGNPPFIEEFNTLYAKKINDKYSDKRKIPGNQLALLFLEQAMQLCKNKNTLCLIMPSGPFLYNNNSKAFRKYFIEQYKIKQIIDFTSLKSILYSSANVATIAVFVRKEKPDGKNILHVTARRTKSSKEKIFFEIDYYDFNHVKYNEALNNALVWKTNLMGGGRLHNIMSRLIKLRSLGEYLEEKVKNHGWEIGEGFKVGRKTKSYEASYLTNKKTLPSNAFTDQGIDFTKVHILEDKYFNRIANENKNIFKGPHLLIKEGVTKSSIPIKYLDQDLSFKHGVTGIHAPKKDANKLKNIEKRILGNRIYLYYVANFSGAYLISRATAILKKDILCLPYPIDDKELSLSKIEQLLVNDVLDYMLEFLAKGENSKATSHVDSKQLNNYGRLYCRILNKIYKNFVPMTPIESDSFICYPFGFNNIKKPPSFELGQIEKHLNKLIYKKYSTSLRVIRVIRLYDKNIIYMIKPKQKRYWLNSIAIKDADDTFNDLIIQGY